MGAAHPLHAWCRTAAACSALLLPAAAGALTWDYTPFASVGVGYETNPYLASNSEFQDDAFALLGSAYLDIVGEDATSRIGFRPEVSGAQYSGSDQSLNRDDNYLNYYLPVSASQVWQTARASGTAGFTRISTRDIVSTNPNDPSRPGTTSTLRATDYQERWYLAPSLQYQLTARDTLALTLNYDDVSFTEARFTGRSDYVATAGELSWQRAVTPRTQVSLSLTGNGFQATSPRSPVENDTFSYGMSAGYQYVLTETSSVGVTAGASRSDVKIKGLPAVSTVFGPLPCLDPATNEFTACTLKGTDDNFVGQLFYRQRSGKTITTELSLSRSLQPNSDGSQVTLDALRAYLTKDLGPLLSLSLGGLYTRQEAVASQGGVLSQRFSRDYYQVDFSVRRRLNRTWAVSGQYTYTDDRQTAGSTYSVPDHRINFYLQYSGLGSH